MLTQTKHISKRCFQICIVQIKYSGPLWLKKKKSGDVKVCKKYSGPENDQNKYSGQTDPPPPLEV